MEYIQKESFSKKREDKKYRFIVIIDIDQTLYNSEHLSELVIYKQEEMIKQELKNTDLGLFEDLHKRYTKTKLIEMLNLKEENNFLMNSINMQNPKIDFQKAKNIDLLKDYRDKFIIGLDTNSPKIYSSKILQKIGLSDLYDFILFDSGKPSVNYTEFYRSLLGEKTKDSFHIGDSLRKDVIPFQEIGGKGIHYIEFAGRTPECPDCGSDLCTDDFKEIIEYIERFNSII